MPNVFLMKENEILSKLFTISIDEKLKFKSSYNMT